MDIRKTLSFGNALSQIELLYVISDFAIGDTSEPISYPDCKLSVTLSDGMDAVCRDRIYPLSVGDIEVFAPNEMQFARINRSGIHRFLDIYIQSSFFDDFSLCNEKVKKLFFDDSSNRSNRIRATSDKRSICESAERIATAMASDGNENDLVIFSEILKLIVYASDHYTENSDEDFLMPVTVAKTIHIIDEHYAEPLTLAQLSSSAGCSVTGLTSAFKKCTGKTVITYITERRLHNAKLLLSDGASVTDACFDSGFTDCSYFIKTFKKYYNCTPLEYKRSSKS